MIFDIVTVKDPSAAVLRTVCHDVKVFNRELFDLAQNLVDTMFAANGVGLAAPQVGISLNLFVMRTAKSLANNTRDVHILVNPQSSTNNTEKYKDMEGCLSIPGLLGRVERYKELQCAYVNVEGRPQTTALAGLSARIFQHELDHLYGVLFTDKADQLFRRVEKEDITDEEQNNGRV